MGHMLQFFNDKGLVVLDERVERKKKAHLHLYVKEKYYHIIVMGLRKQLESYKVMLPDFLEKTFRKDLDFKNFEVNQYVQY